MADQGRVGSPLGPFSLLNQGSPRMKRASVRCLGVALAATFCLALQSPSRAAEPVRIGLIMPLKVQIGKQGAQGAELAVEMINSAGGILGGRRIELVPYDTNNSAAEGVAAVQRLLDRDRVQIIVGEAISTVALSVVPLFEGRNAIFVAAIPKHPDVTSASRPNVFRMNSTVTMDSAVFNAMLRDAKASKVAAIVENSDYGRLNLQNLKTLYGAQLVFSDTYEPTQSDFNSLVTNAKGSGADLICILGANVEQYSNALRVLGELGYKQKKCLASGTLNNQVPRIAGVAANGTLSVDIYLPDYDAPLNRRFVLAFRAKHHADPDKLELLGFESVWIVAQAIEKSGTATDMVKLASTLHGGEWDSPRGRLTFDKSGQAVGGQAFRITVKDGALVEVKP
jgi:branched-chain amino acid transport system substrate-binding protein